MKKFRVMALLLVVAMMSSCLYGKKLDRGSSIYVKYDAEADANFYTHSLFNFVGERSILKMKMNESMATGNWNLILMPQYVSVIHIIINEIKVVNKETGAEISFAVDGLKANNDFVRIFYREYARSVFTFPITVEDATTLREMMKAEKVDLVFVGPTKSPFAITSNNKEAMLEMLDYYFAQTE
ncbi:MAG: hypothetical protein JXR63_05055 [Spirochaetales bacterium]|nr:hypothetical protein [Spirochaetales bacterium]